MNNQKPIGFFDSGWGGLSILKTAREVLPAEDFLYVADCGFAPYGDQSHDFIVERARRIAAFLFDKQQVRALVVACNTATAEAIDTLRQDRPEAIIIGVEPAIKPAVAISQNQKIGMIATTRTTQSLRYNSLLQRFAQKATVFTQGCPGLMDCVEAGAFKTASTLELLHRYIDPMLENHIDTLVLGCTHYPFLMQAIRSVVGPEVNIYEPSLGVSLHLKHRLTETGRLVTGSQRKGKNAFYVSGLTEQRKNVANLLWGQATSFENLCV